MKLHSIYFEKALETFLAFPALTNVEQGNPLLASDLRTAFHKARETLDERFLSGGDIRSLIAAHSSLTDHLLKKLWTYCQLDSQENISLLAVGGYGRGELHPHSDIDLLILTKEPLEANHELTNRIERFITLLWDLKLKVGHSVRDIDHCVSIAKDDLSVVTNLLECRLLSGNASLIEAVTNELNHPVAWSHQAFFDGRISEQEERHCRYEGSEYMLEPNLKGCRGGLRDIQVIRWVARRYFSSQNIEVLLEAKIFTKEDLDRLIEVEDFLWRCRYALHLLADRDENRLLFDFQKKVARMLGFSDDNKRLAVEHLMKAFYEAIMSISVLNELFLQMFASICLSPNTLSTASELDADFILRNGYIEAKSNTVFSKQPSRLLSIFKVLAQTENCKGIEAKTLRQLRSALHLIDDEFRATPDNHELFLEIFRSTPLLYNTLKKMHLYGVLGRYLPAFGAITGLMQYDLFHTYTVDAHTLRLIEYIQRLYQPNLTDDFPLVSRVVRQLPKPEILLLAALFHDIAKGRGGDHSQLGKVDALSFGQLHNLPDDDSETIAWLVEHHLLMSTTAQRKDISDPDIIMEFAQNVQYPYRLDYLYCLTVVDINATNPSLWNSWRASLLQQLYSNTKQALRRGLSSPLEKQEIIEATQAATRLMLSQSGYEEDHVQHFWNNFEEDFFLRTSVSELNWQTSAILDFPDASVVVQGRLNTDLSSKGTAQVFVFSQNINPNCFSIVTSTLDSENLNVVDARLTTCKSGQHLEVYSFISQETEGFGQHPHRLEQICEHIQTALELDTPIVPSGRHISRQLKAFPIETEVQVVPGETEQVTQIELIAADRPGLLAQLSRLFIELGLLLKSARISTLGERVEDIFSVTDIAGNPLKKHDDYDRIIACLCDKIDPNQ